MYQNMHGKHDNEHTDLTVTFESRALLYSPKFLVISTVPEFGQRLFNKH